MLAKNMDRKQFPSYTEDELVSWVADGKSFFIGFTATGSYSAEFRLYVTLQDGQVTPVTPIEECWYVFQTSPGNRTAYMADRATRFPQGTVVSLRVFHESEQRETFVGTLLGGTY